MKAEWLSDARKIPDEVMNYVRRIAVCAIEEKQYSPELVADLLGISRSSIYDWLNRYRQDGEAALDTGTSPGAPPILSPEMDRWLETTLLHSTPEEHGYDTVLWTLKIIVNLLKDRFGIEIAPATVASHLHRLQLSCQQPVYRALGQDPEKVKRYLKEEFPEIQKLAEELGADIGFEDESWMGASKRSGRTWGRVGSPPKVRVSDDRGGYHVLSMITAQGELVYRVDERSINSQVYIEFLKKLLAERTRPLLLIADNASYHNSLEVQHFVAAHRDKLRLFFLPSHSPEFNPDEQVWNEVKHRNLEKKPIKSKKNLEYRLYVALEKLKRNVEKIRSFFKLPETRYAGLQETPA